MQIKVLYFFAFFNFLLIQLIINQRTTAEKNPITVIGDKNVTRRIEVINQTFSKLFIDGPFYCLVTWINQTQTVDISTHSNIQPYIVVRVEDDTLKIIFQSDGNFKFTEMDVYINICPTINEINLAGVTTLQSANVFKRNDPLRIYTQDTSTLILELDVVNLNALFLSAGNTKLTGQVKQTGIFKYNGVGNVDASQLACKFVDVEANGLGTIWVKGTDRCIIKAKGVSIVKYNCSTTSQVQVTDLAKVIPV